MKTNRRNTLRTLSLAAIAALPPLAARAQSTWVPTAGTQNWKNAANWDTGKIPTSAISVTNTSPAGATISTPIGGAAGLVKGGTGVLVLDAANTYAGATTVSAGTLRINGSATNSASLTVASGATFEAGATQSLKALTVNDTGLAKIAAPAATLTAKSLTVAPQGRVDVGTGMLVVDYTGAFPVTTIRNALATGYAGGTRADPGIASSSIAGTANALGYAEASTLVGPTGGRAIPEARSLQ